MRYSNMSKFRCKSRCKNKRSKKIYFSGYSKKNNSLLDALFFRGGNRR